MSQNGEKINDGAVQINESQHFLEQIEVKDPQSDEDKRKPREKPAKLNTISALMESPAHEKSFNLPENSNQQGDTTQNNGTPSENKKNKNNASGQLVYSLFKRQERKKQKNVPKCRKSTLTRIKNISFIYKKKDGIKKGLFSFIS